MNNYDLWLASIPGIGAKTVFSMRLMTGLAEEFSEYLYKSDEKETLRLVQQICGSGKRAENSIGSILAAKRLDPVKMAEELYKKDIRFVSYDDAGFPERLRTPDPSFFGLFYKGTLPPGNTGSVGIIGTRKPTGYGTQQARRFAVELASHGIMIVSGMARGIDGTAGMGAVDAGGFTTAVLGCGVDICYPKENINLYNAICSSGCVMSEFAPGTQPVSANFPLRNRIISALSDLIIVIEAMEKSGTMITVDYALSQGKDVFALPGRVCDRSSAGCNYLIRQGAGIAICPEDILFYFESMGFQRPEGHTPERHSRTTKQYEDCKKSSELLNLVSLRKERAETILANRRDENLKMILGCNEHENSVRQVQQESRRAALSLLQRKILQCLDEVQPSTPESVMAAMAARGERISIQEAAGQLTLMAAMGNAREVATGCFVRC